MTYPKAVLLNDTSSFNHHGCHLVVEQIRRQCEEHGLNLWHRVKFGDDWRGPIHRKRVVEADIVIVNGEGLLHHDQGVALALVQSAQFCRERNIPCVLINSVYQDNGPEMARFVRQFDRVFARESRSQVELRNAGIDSEVVPDMTLSHADLSQYARNGIVFTDSSNDVSTDQLHEFYARTEGAELASLFRPPVTPRVLRKLTVGVLKKRAPKLWRWEQRLASRARHPLFDAAPLNRINILLKRISSTGLIVTGRFHMVCLAMLARTPFIALEGNTHKIQALLADANLSDRFRSSLPDDLDLLAWSNWHDGEIGRVEAYLKMARSRISQMFSQIRQLAGRDDASRVAHPLVYRPGHRGHATK